MEYIVPNPSKARIVHIILKTKLTVILLLIKNRHCVHNEIECDLRILSNFILSSNSISFTDSIHIVLSNCVLTG